jgi:CHASE3 domain sensor protein
MNRLLMYRMAAPFVIVSFMLLGLGISGAWYVQRLQKSSSELLNWNVTSIRAAQELEIGIRDIRNRLNAFLISGDRQHLAAALSLPPVDHWLGEAERLARSPHEQELVERTKQGYRHFFTEFDAAHDGTSPQRIRYLVEEVLSKQVLPPASKYLDISAELAEQSAEQNKVLADRLALAFLLLGTCGAVAGLVAGLGLTRMIHRGFVRLDVPIRDATGKLNEVVGPIILRGEISFEQLEDAMGRVAAEVGTIVARLQQSQREVLRGSSWRRSGSWRPAWPMSCAIR